MGVFIPINFDADQGTQCMIKQEELTMKCPHCQSENTRVIDTTHDARGGIRRRRECENCKQRFSTYERAILSTPLIVKKDNTREEFDKEKLIQGIRIACAKRPVPAAEIERLAGEVEAELQQMNKLEIPSRFIGDMVIEGLRNLDHIAYIRYAIVYLPLIELKDIQKEVNELLKMEGDDK